MLSAKGEWMHLKGFAAILQREIVLQTESYLPSIWSLLKTGATHAGENLFSHLCLYEIGFLPMLETSVSHDHALGPLVHLKREKKNPSRVSPYRIGKSHPWVRNFNHGLGKPCPWLKFLPIGWDFPILHGHSWWVLTFREGTNFSLKLVLTEMGEKYFHVFLWRCIHSSLWKYIHFQGRQLCQNCFCPLKLLELHSSGESYRKKIILSRSGNCLWNLKKCQKYCENLRKSGNCQGIF